MLNDSISRIKPHTTWQVLCDSDAELCFFVTCIMMEPPQGTPCRTRIFVTTEGFSKAMRSGQNVPSHRHISPYHVPNPSIFCRHPPIRTSYYPIKLIWKPGWTAYLPKRINLASNADYPWAHIVRSQILYPTWLRDGVIIQKSQHFPLRHCPAAVS